MGLRSNSIKLISNIPGWRTSRRIVLFESDDWGSNRMPSFNTYQTLLKKGVPVNKNHFTHYDRIEGGADMNGILEVLSRFTDVNGNHPVFTTLNIMANPDFPKIKEAGYHSYYFEPFEKTLELYGEANAVKEAWKTGMKEGLLEPQFHGREHLNVHRWMKGLQEDLPTTKLAAEYGVTGIAASIVDESRGDYQAAFDHDADSHLDSLTDIINEGIDMFKRYFGCSATYFYPTNGLFSSKLFPLLKKAGIRALGVSKINAEPLGNGLYKKRLKFLGATNQFGQTYITRNCLFEPSAPISGDWVDSCMRDMSLAFAAGKPAIISSHRVNYVGGIDKENRINGLKKLESLIKKIGSRWPDVEYVSTSQLVAIMQKE